MIDYLKIGIVSLVVTVAFFLAFGHGSQSQNLGALNNATSTITNPYKFQQGLAVGTATTDTLVTSIRVGTCNALTAGISQNASTTNQWDCAVSGVTSADKVFITLPRAADGQTTNAAAAAFPGFVVVNASASSTAGFITMRVWNGTGLATSTFPQATTSIQYVIFRSN